MRAIVLQDFTAFVGWGAIYTLVLFRLGAMTRLAFAAILENPGSGLVVDSARRLRVEGGKDGS